MDGRIIPPSNKANELGRCDDSGLPAALSSVRLDAAGAFVDELEAGLYTGEAAGTRFPRTPVEQWARYDTLHLMTAFGPIDIVFAPDGAPAGYSDLAKMAERATLDDEPVMAISVPTWEALKQATGRAKDLEHLDSYYESRRLDE